MRFEPKSFAVPRPTCTIGPETPLSGVVGGMMPFGRIGESASGWATPSRCSSHRFVRACAAGKVWTTMTSAPIAFRRVSTCSAAAA